MSIFFRNDGWVKTTFGVAVPGAQVYVCYQPATTTAVPPSPLATLFSDSLGATPLAQPVITDGFGHYNFYVAPGFYTVVIVFGGVVQQVYQDQAVGITGSTVSPLTLEVNGVPASSQALQNLTQGTGIGITDLGGGVVRIASTNTGTIGAGVANQLAKYTGTNSIAGDSILTENGLDLLYVTANGHGICLTATNGPRMYAINGKLYLNSGGESHLGSENSGYGQNVYIAAANVGGISGQLSLDVYGASSVGVTVGGNGGTNNVVKWFQQTGGNTWVGIQAPSSGITNWTATLPPTAPTTKGQFLFGNSDGTLAWQNPLKQFIILFEANGSAVAVTGQNVFGAASSPNLGGPAAVGNTAPTATEPPYLTLNTGAVGSANAAGIDEASNPGGVTLGILDRFYGRIKPSASTSARYWVGLTDQQTAANTTMFATDTPAALVMGFRYSSGINGNWWIVCSQAGGANRQTADSTIAVDTTAPHEFEITYDGTHVNYWIDGVKVGFFSANLPVTSTGLHWFAMTDNLGLANARTLSVNKLYATTTF